MRSPASKANAIAALTALLVCLATAQEPAPAAKIEGAVVDTSGRPLAQAKLSLRPDGASRISQIQPAPFNAQSGADGRFSFNAVSIGRYLLTIEKTGFLKQVYWNGVVLDLNPGDRLKDLHITLKSIAEAATVSGRALNEDGDPLRGVGVELSRDGYTPNGRRILSQVAAGSTDALGAYRMIGVPAGEFSLSATAAGYSRTYYNTRTVAIGDGAKLQGMDFRLSKLPTVHLSGRVTGDMPMSILLRSRIAENSAGNAQAALASDGSFQFTAPQGSYTLSAIGTNLTGRLDVDLRPAGLTDVVVPVHPTLEVTGRVAWEAQPIPSLSLFLFYFTSDSAISWKGGAARADGTFSITGLDYTKYFLDANPPPPPGTYIASARIGDRDVLNAGLDLTSGAPAGPLVVTLKRTSSDITGSVKTPGAIVTLIPEPPRPEQSFLYRRVSTDQNGAFILKDLAPGDYRIYAWEGLPTNAELNIDFVQPHREKGIRVTVTGSSRVNVGQLPELPGN